MNEIIPICTNLRYDGTNELICFDIGEFRRQNLSGEIIVYSDNEIIYNSKFKSLNKIPAGFSFHYKREKKEEIIIAKLKIENKVAQDKLIMNEESTRNPITWEDLKNKGNY